MKFSSLSRFSRGRVGGGGEIRVIRVRVNRVKMAEKWGEIQGEMDLVRVSRKFELSGKCPIFVHEDPVQTTNFS